MEINFKKISLDDKPFIDGIMKTSSKRFCEYTFGNIFCWGAKYGMQIAKTENAFVIGSPEKARFNYPAGEGADALAAALIEKFVSVTFTCMDEREAEYLKVSYGFEITAMQARRDYIYTSEKLATLSGKKLAAKRNHINAFLADGNYHTEPITSENIESLFAFNESWCDGLCEAGSDLYAEMCVVKTGLQNFDALCYKGLILYKNDKICAYSYGEPINADTFCVHVEKADSDVRGAYQMINREFVRSYCLDYRYVNREDDAGDEGLRKAKLSYYPEPLGEKFKGELKR